MKTLHSLHPYDGDVGEKWCTVRRGPKWYYDTDQDLALCECTHNWHPSEDGMNQEWTEEDGYLHTVIGHGRIINRLMIPFAFIKEEMIANEHEEEARTVEGLLASMRRAYGPDFRDTELCTILTYWRTD